MYYYVLLCISIYYVFLCIIMYYVVYYVIEPVVWHCGQALGSSMRPMLINTSRPLLHKKHLKYACFRSGMTAEQRVTYVCVVLVCVVLVCVVC
jgi:hypothetical protein